MEDGEVADDDKKDLLPSQKLEQGYAKLKDTLDQLKDTKSEMVWLLKQVIKAEKKRKDPDTGAPLLEPPKKKQLNL